MKIAVVGDVGVDYYKNLMDEVKGLINIPSLIDK